MWIAIGSPTLARGVTIAMIAVGLTHTFGSPHGSKAWVRACNHSESLNLALIVRGLVFVVHEAFSPRHDTSMTLVKLDDVTKACKKLDRNSTSIV